MTKHPQTAANTRYAFASIATMLAAFLLFVAVMLLPLGLTWDTQVSLDTVFTLRNRAVCRTWRYFFCTRCLLRKKNGA